MRIDFLVEATAYTISTSIMGFVVGFLLLKITTNLSFKNSRQWIAFLLTWGANILFYVFSGPFNEDLILSFVYTTVAATIAIFIVQMNSKNKSTPSASGQNKTIEIESLGKLETELTALISEYMQRFGAVPDGAIKRKWSDATGKPLLETLEEALRKNKPVSGWDMLEHMNENEIYSTGKPLFDTLDEGFRNNRLAPECEMTMHINKNEAYAIAWEELESGNTDKSIWAKAFVDHNGDEEKCKVEYIKQRVILINEQMEAERIQLERKLREKAEKEANEVRRMARDNAQQNLEDLLNKIGVDADSDVMLPIICSLVIDADWSIDNIYESINERYGTEKARQVFPLLENAKRKP